MDKEALVRMKTIGELPWEERNPIGYVFYPAEGREPEKIQLVDTLKMEDYQTMWLVDDLQSLLSHLHRKKMIVGRRLTIPLSEIGTTRLFCFGLGPEKIEVVEGKGVRLIMPVGQILAIFTQNGQKKMYYYYV